ITQEASGSLEDLEIIQEEDTHPSINTSLNHEDDDLEIDKPQSDIVPIRRSTRTRHAPDRMCLYIDVEEHELGDLVELPPNGKIIGSKWLFKKKINMDRVLHTYKARLVAKGYTQTTGIDYEETFSPVADIRAIRILIAITAYYDYEIWQMDVKLVSSMDISMKRCFAMKDLGEADILGIKIYKDRSQCIPMQEKLKLSKSQGALTSAKVKRMQNVSYASVVGSIMYSLRCTRPDVAKECQAKHFATSSVEAEYIAAIDAYKEAVWVRKIISRLGVVLTFEEPISMYCDNTRAIAIANESRIPKGARHFRTKVHYLREVIEYGDVKFEKVHTDDNLEDTFSKAMA
nr:hypothetical protein [Tanacetum cinerariifolium]